MITHLDVRIDGIWHQRPDDLELLLVGPQGQKVVLMSDACGSFEAKAFGWTWGDEASDPMPDGGPCGSSVYRPTDYEPGDVWPAPAPPGPYAGSLSAFDLTDPNGDWRLFVVDDSSERSASSRTASSSRSRSGPRPPWPSARMRSRSRRVRGAHSP